MDDDRPTLSFESIMAQLKHQENIQEKVSLERRIQELSTISQELSHLKPGRRVYTLARPGNIFFLNSSASAVHGNVKKELGEKQETLRAVARNIASFNQPPSVSRK